jgi:hypothetical protein
LATVPTFRGNRGNLLQHWVLSEVVSILEQHQPPAARLCFVDAHAMSPYATRSEAPSQTGGDFTTVAERLPGVGSTYERTWHTLRQGRIEYPSSASIVRRLWKGSIQLVLCEQDPATAKDIAAWHRTIPDTRVDLYEGDWRERFRKPFPRTADSYVVSFDPYMFNRHARRDAANGGRMGPADLITAMAPLVELPAAPTMIQLSTYSSNDDNSQQDVLECIEPVIEAAGFTLACLVRAGGDMMSLVFVRDLGDVILGDLPERFSDWLKAATAPGKSGVVPIDATKAIEIDELSSGDTKTTQIGYVNRNQQRCDGHRDVAGTDHGQRAYKMTCLDCGHTYGANGTDVFQRKCPGCGGGAEGIPF